jgi:hypothetical protein
MVTTVSPDQRGPAWRMHSVTSHQKAQCGLSGHPVRYDPSRAGAHLRTERGRAALRCGCCPLGKGSLHSRIVCNPKPVVTT